MKKNKIAQNNKMAETLEAVTHTHTQYLYTTAENVFIAKKMLYYLGYQK